MDLFEDMNSIIGDTLIENIEMININDLVQSQDNIFKMTGIEEFAEMILAQGGVKENLIVRPSENGKYEIISGHRRTAAARLLLERGENISPSLPCLVMEYEDEDDKKLNLILMNLSARVISDSEIWNAFEILNGIFQRKKAMGEKLGKIRDKIAETLNISLGQVAKIQNVSKNAPDELIERIKNGDISIRAANELLKNGKNVTRDTFDSETQNKEINGKSVTRDTFDNQTQNKEINGKSVTRGTFDDEDFFNQDVINLITIMKRNREFLMNLLENYEAQENEKNTINSIYEVLRDLY